jgi:rRNA pseudouridine-1189 N-methylase Emg1 (Nep1/Mra1 family)
MITTGHCLTDYNSRLASLNPKYRVPTKYDRFQGVFVTIMLNETKIEMTTRT